MPASEVADRIRNFAQRERPVDDWPVGVPYVVVHDSDARPSGKPIASERALNALIAETAEEGRRVVLEPDFESIAEIKGRRHKPERAWRQFATLAPDEIPNPLRRAAELAVELARAR